MLLPQKKKLGNGKPGTLVTRVGPLPLPVLSSARFILRSFLPLLLLLLLLLIFLLLFLLLVRLRPILLGFRRRPLLPPTTAKEMKETRIKEREIDFSASRTPIGFAQVSETQ